MLNIGILICTFCSDSKINYCGKTEKNFHVMSKLYLQLLDIN